MSEEFNIDELPELTFEVEEEEKQEENKSDQNFELLTNEQIIDFFDNIVGGFIPNPEERALFIVTHKNILLPILDSIQYSKNLNNIIGKMGAGALSPTTSLIIGSLALSGSSLFMANKHGANLHIFKGKKGKKKKENDKQKEDDKQ